MNGENAFCFPFHYGTEAEQYTFYRVPKVLFTESIFRKLSTDAKLLYGLLLDRMQLSVRNQWIDEEGKVYIYFTIGSVMEALACGNKKASQLMAELDDQKGIGLITRVRQGLGKPDKIFVHKCTVPEMSYSHVQRCQNDTSGDVISTGQEVSKGHTNDTEYKDTDRNDTDPIYRGWGGDRIEEYNAYKSYFLEKLSFDILLLDYPYEKDILKEILELILETVCTTRDSVRVSGEDKPTELVRSRLMKLDVEHIRYVMQCMKENTTCVRNIRQYMLTTLYNAPVTINHYYAARVNYDLYGGGAFHNTAEGGGETGAGGSQ